MPCGPRRAGAAGLRSARSVGTGGRVTTGDGEIEAASELLWQHWQERRRLAELPEAMRPRTRQDGYAVQALLEQRSAFPLFGWKIAATSTAGQAHIAVNGPMAGRLLRERVRDNG